MYTDSLKVKYNTCSKYHGASGPCSDYEDLNTQNGYELGYGLFSKDMDATIDLSIQNQEWDSLFENSFDGSYVQYKPCTYSGHTSCQGYMKRVTATEGLIESIERDEKTVYTDLYDPDAITEELEIQMTN